MTGRVLFENWRPDAIITMDNARDLVDLFYMFDADVIVHGCMPDKRERGSTRGLHVWTLDGHDIFLSWKNIRSAFNEGKPIGGNIFVPNIKVCAGMTLAHEITHANQHHKHSEESKSFWKRRSRYMTRPSEMEARTFADNNIDIIASVVGVSLPGRDRGHVVNGDGELQDIIEALSDVHEISIHDVVDELRRSGVNNPINVGKVVDSLRLLGVEVYTHAP